MTKNKIFILLLIIFATHLFFRVYQYKDNYTQMFDSKYWESRFLKSQWVVSYSKEPIGDDGLYTYAGWKYVHGMNPVLNSAEVPPLGKYILGFSILIFNNQNIFALIAGLLALTIFYLLNLELFKKNKIAAFIPVLLFSLEPLFYQQLRAPFFDLLFLFFLLLTFLFIYKRKYFWSAIFLGCFAATKNSYLSLVVVFSVIAYLLVERKIEDLKKYLISMPLALGVFTLTYIQYFLLGNSLKDFLGVQKWILNFYLIGAKAKFGAIFSMINFGRWETWWGETTKVNEWGVLWPIIFALSFLYLFQIILKKKKDNLLLILIWTVCYLAFLSFIPSFPRYLLLLLPFMYNLSIWFLLKNIFPKLPRF